MPISEPARTRMLGRLELLYGDRAADCLNRIDAIVDRAEVGRQRRSNWSEKDVVLITYGDQVADEQGTPLSALDRFLADHELSGVINTIHFLPFFPYTSDDGFSVSDYRQVDPALGDWDDVAELGRVFGLMFDLVLNHCSQQHEWFQKFLLDESPYDRFFHVVDPATDLSGVTRPRSHPLLSPYAAAGGMRHVWTTFSDDQVDLNFAEPELLVEMLDVLLFYVAKGARIVRLDAIAYLWKHIGTNCIHLPETHEVVKLMRDLLDAAAPGTILLTETNVPHAENVSYFGDGDEAQMVYQFSLAPLLLDAFLSEDAGLLNRWLADLEPCRPGTTCFNFTASHDGVGVRPLEGLVPQERLDRLVAAVRERGGRVSMKRNTDGTDSPYELNITVFSALGDPDGLDAELHARRFLTSQAVMLGLRGIPGVYFHSLVGTPNFEAGVEQTARARTINRRKFQRDELDEILADEDSAQRRVLDGYRRMLAVRIAQPAFHPDAAQEVVEQENPAVVAFLRTSINGEKRILVAANVSAKEASLDLTGVDGSRFTRDLLTDAAVEEDRYVLPPFGAAWLTA